MMSSQLLKTIDWPSIIKLYADDELIFVRDVNAFENDETLRQTRLQKEDNLIDASGRVYRLSYTGSLTLIPTADRMSLDEVVELLRLHLSNHGSCCVAKFDANSIREAITSVLNSQTD